MIYLFTLEKHPLSNTLIVKKDNEEIDQIHYSSIDELCYILKKYYSDELFKLDNA